MYNAISAYLYLQQSSDKSVECNAVIWRTVKEDRLVFSDCSAVQLLHFQHPKHSLRKPLLLVTGRVHQKWRWTCNSSHYRVHELIAAETDKHTTKQTIRQIIWWHCLFWQMCESDAYFLASTSDMKHIRKTLSSLKYQARPAFKDINHLQRKTCSNFNQCFPFHIQIQFNFNGQSDVSTSYKFE